MSDELWRELQDTIHYEAASVQATGVIVPSPARKRNLKNGVASNENSPSSEQQQQHKDRSVAIASSTTTSSGGVGVSAGSGARNHPAMLSFFQALSTLGLTKTSFRGLATLHNAAQLGVWHSHSSGANAQLRHQVAERAAANSAAIEQQLQEATDRARGLREEQQRQLDEQRKQQDGGANEKNDAYLRDLQRSRIDAEFERMRDQLRAEDAARREQLEHAREEKAKAVAEEDLAERKRKIREEREQRHRERNEKAKSLRALEVSALAGLEGAIRERDSLKAPAGGAEEF